MHLDIKFPLLENLVRQMGATPVYWTSDADALSKINIKELLLQGIEIDPGEVEVLDGGLLTYRGEHVLLYIRDTRNNQFTLEHDPENAVRFHVADCTKLEEMRSKGKFNKYVVTNDTSGLFKVEFNDWKTGDTGTTEAELKVCKLCLKKLDYERYAHVNYEAQQEIWKAFSLDAFFESYQSRFRDKPKFTAENYPKGGYSENWEKVSQDFRSKQNWKCENCGVDLSKHPSLLHAHHVDGVKGHNEGHNLKALCIQCHSEQPDHRHMHVPRTSRLEINRLRREQGISAVSNRDTPKQVLSIHKNKGSMSQPPISEIKKSDTEIKNIRPDKMLSYSEARNALIQLRSKIVASSTAERKEGVLRKTMLKHFLDDRIISEEKFKQYVPLHEINKTDKTQLSYLPQIFSIINQMEE